MKIWVRYFVALSGLLTVLFEWSALLFFYFNKPIGFNGGLSISYFATLPQTKTAFTLFYLLAATSCWIFFRYYLSRYYRVSYKLFGYSLITFACVAIFPFQFSDQVSYGIHLFFAVSTFSAFILGLFDIGKQTKDFFVKRSSYLAGSACALFGLLHIGIPKTYGLNFSFEVYAWLALQLWIIVMSIYTYRKNL